MKTAEFVSPKHPDKMCDIISDKILDAVLLMDENARCAIETCGGHGHVYITGEITTKHDVSFYELAKNVVDEVVGIDSCTIDVNIAKQSPEIAKGVDVGGAGDQGVMFGYAWFDEKTNYLPPEYFFARELCNYIYSQFPFDGKTQITICRETYYIDKIIVSWSNIKTKVIENLIDEFLFKFNLKSPKNKIINPCGDWFISGFDADAGCTGRKIVVDAYGPEINVGGGAFSGKDGTKVDRSAAMMLRKIAVEQVKHTELYEIKLSASYAIGLKEPTLGSGFLENDFSKKKLEEFKQRLQPQRIIDELKLRRPIFAQLAEFGHFGKGWDLE